MMKYSNRSLRRRNGDKWEASFSHPDPISGETIRSYCTIVAKTEKAAAKARDELRIKLEVEGNAATSNTTIREYLSAYIDRREQSKSVEGSTIRGYRVGTNIIGKYIGDMRLTALDIPAVDRWMAKMIEDGYSPATCSKTYQLLKMALKDAMARDLVKKNPCEFVKPPKRSKQEITALNAEERRRMLAIVHENEPTPLKLAVEMALATGMRRSEICALRWSDLDDEGIIHVRSTIGSGKGGFYIKSTKTVSSTRRIPLVRQTYDLLMAYRSMLERKAEGLGVPFGDPYILGTIGMNSRFYNPTRLSKEFTVFAELHGFKCTFHDLRHTFATFMVAAGVDIATIASYLGHSNVAVTLNVYATVDPDAKKAAVSKVAEALGMEERPVS